ncbi:MAG: hypothetical protein AAGF47_02575 [Planctomycetota bacterium]
MTDWTSTTTAAEIANWIGDAASIAIVTHARPDGDAVGSSFALCRALKQEAV